MIRVIDNNELISISLDDMVLFHGRHAIAGVGLGYKALEFISYSGISDLQRGRIKVETAFSGKGFMDAFEMTLKTCSGGGYIINPSMDGIEKALPAPDGNHFLFKVSSFGAEVLFTVKDNVIPKEYYDMMASYRERGRPEDMDSDLHLLREKIAESVAKLSPDEIFTLISSKNDAKTIVQDASASGKYPPVTVDDKYGVIEIPYEGFIHYSGTSAICGATLIYNLFREAHSHGIELERSKTKMTFGVIGDGIRDVSEMALRCWTAGTAVIDRAFGASFGMVAAPGGFSNGAFVFRIDDGKNAQTFALKESLYPFKYMEIASLGKTRPLTDDEVIIKRTEQLNFVKSMLASDKVFDLI